MIGEADFSRLTAGRWLVPLMAHVEAEDGSRFAAMLARLGLSRSALAASLGSSRKRAGSRAIPATATRSGPNMC